MVFFQKDVFVVSCDLVTDIALHHLADIHRSHDSTLSVFLAPVPQTSADREAASNPKAKKKTDSTGKMDSDQAFSKMGVQVSCIVGVSNGICEHASSAFIFASTSSDLFCHASSEY